MKDTTANTTKRHDTDESTDEIDESIWHVLNKTKRSDSSFSQQARKEYENRLLSFRASTYYAKPACLSPLLCARLGWVNAEQDILSCSSCQAALSINTIPSSLSAEAMEKLCAAYRQQLLTAHQPYCSFRIDTDQPWLNPTGTSSITETTSQSPIIPRIFATVFPSDLVELMDHPSPSHLLKKQVQILEDLLSLSSSSSSTTTRSGWELPELEISPEIQTFRLFDDDTPPKSANTPTNTATSTDVVAIDVMTKRFCKDKLGIQHPAMVWLVVMGWTPISKTAVEVDLESQNPIISLGCPLCFSIMEISLQSVETDLLVEEKDEEENRRPLKRQKRLARCCNPHDAHRHYCPYVCGFPTTIIQKGTPLWQVLLSRWMKEPPSLVTTNDDNHNRDKLHECEDPIGVDGSRETVLDPEKALARIRGILLSGIVSKKVELDTDYDDDDDDYLHS